MEHWDLIVIGAGSAGMTAGIYGVRSGLKTLILEKQIPGGLTATSPWIENYPGFPEGISGADLAEKMLKQCKKLGAEVRVYEDVVGLGLTGDRKMVRTGKSKYAAGAVIIASGSQHMKLGIQGEDKFQGRGVSYCAVCDAFFFKDKRVLAVGGGNCAAMSALYLAGLASEVCLAHRRDVLRAEEAYIVELKRKNVSFLWNTEVKEIRGKEAVEGVVLLNNETGETREMKIDGVFIFVGEAPNSGFAKKAGVEVDEKDYIITDPLQRTNVQGVYAAGDVTSCPVKQIGTAVGHAVMAATEAFEYVRQPYYRK